MKKQTSIKSRSVTKVLWNLELSLKRSVMKNGIELKSRRQMVSIIQSMSLLWCYQERFEASDRNIPL